MLGKVRHPQLVCWHGGMDNLTNTVGSWLSACLPAYSGKPQPFRQYIVERRMRVQGWSSCWRVPEAQQLTKGVG